MGGKYMLKTILYGLLFAAGCGGVAMSILTLQRANVNLGNCLPGIIGALLLLYVIFHNTVNRWTEAGIGRWLRYGFIFGCLFVAVTFVGQLLMMRQAAKQVPDAGHDAVVILGAGLVYGDRLSLTLAARLDKALIYIEENPHTVVVVTGGQGPDEAVTEASAMAAYLIRQGVSPERILREDQSTSTKENFLFAKTLLDDYFAGSSREDHYSVVYVTNDFHILRSGYYASQAGFADAEGFACKSLVYMLPQFYMREYLALMAYYVFH